MTLEQRIETMERLIREIHAHLGLDARTVVLLREEDRIKRDVDKWLEKKGEKDERKAGRRKEVENRV